jgi:Lrp/AsnC family transcriptional regulator of ectoine degradation
MAKLSLDQTDIRILTAVQTHGQLSKTRLAEIVNLSPTPCHSRLKRLKTGGFIVGFHANIALNRIVDFNQVMVTVSLAQHRKIDFERFERLISNIDEITECVATGGGMDYVLKVITADLSDFQKLMEQMLAEDLNIDRYMTYIVTRHVKSSQPNISKLLAKADVKPNTD